jgi:transposase
VDHIGIDLHQRESQICIETDQGEVLEKRIRTERERFIAVFGKRPRAKILLEAMTEAEWVARCLEELGHEVIVADPTYAPMYATRSRRVKTDRRDAVTLADACRLQAYRPAHRASDRQRHVRAELAVRDVLVRTRVKCVGLVGALTRRHGIHLPSGNVDGFVARVAALALPEELQGEIAPLIALIRTVSAELEAADARIAAIAADDPVIGRLRTVPGVGPVTATAFVATLDTWERFDGPHQVEAYLGLVPSEKSSGEKQHKGRITKAGNSRARWLLVEAAWSILRSTREDTEPLRRWAQRVALRRGTKSGIVALARKLAGILYAMWRDGSTYEKREGRPAAEPAVAAVA